MQNTSIEDIHPDSTLIQTETAYELNLAEPDYKKLFEFLHSDSFNLVYYALLKIEKFRTKEEAAILLKLLNSENDSRIREHASELIKNHIYYFNDEYSVNTLVQAIKDNNPKVCRNIAECLKCLDNSLQIIQKLIDITKEQLDNKTVFAVYWGLFAIENLLKQNNIDFIENLIQILQTTCKFKEYQIREKTASIVKILVKNNKYKNFKKIYEQLLNDDNFYVKRALSEQF